jgi:predicted amidohydrolase
MRVHVVQVAYSDDESVSDRVARVADLVRAQQGADLVVLPELWAAGGFSYREWGRRAETVDGPVVRAIGAAAADIGSVVHAGSIVERAPDGAPPEGRGPTGRGLWNTSVLLGRDGGVLAVYRKIHRYGFGGGEPALLEAGEQIVTVPLPGSAADGCHEPVIAGLATCYDLRFPEQFRLLLDAGAELVLVPAAWPAARVEHWRLLGRARAIENQLIVVQCNTGGTHAGVEMGGHSQVVSATGDVLAEAGGGEEILAVDIDPAAVAAWRKRFPVLADRRLWPVSTPRRTSRTAPAPSPQP